MSTLNRRNFMLGAAGTLAASAMMPAAGNTALSLPGATDMRTLGNTGLKCSYLGVGTGIKGRGKGISDLTMNLTGEMFVGLLEHAYQRGLTYFDLADQYGSHHFMREAMRRSIPRDEVLLLSKVWSREPDVVHSDLDRMRGELNTDCIDVVLLHCLHRKEEENWPETLRATMDVLSEAKSRGWIRAHGVSCHNLHALERVPDEEWVDVALVRINPFAKNMDGPVDTVADIMKRAHAAGKGMLGMKILGEGDPEVIAHMDDALRFAAEMEAMDAMTIGFMNEAEMDDVIDRINAIASA